MSSGEESEAVSPSAPGTSRKRKRSAGTWKKTIQKKQVIGSDGSQPSLGCAHQGNHWCRSKTFFSEEIVELHDRFYAQETKALQDAYITTLMTVSPVHRHRGESAANERQFAVEYFLTGYNGAKRRVCLESFAAVFCVCKRRVQRLAAYVREHGIHRPEHRGGKRDRPALEECRDKIREHIERFRCVPGHYGRQKTPNRKYLPCTLSIRKMWLMFRDAFSDDPELSACTYDQYRFVFIFTYNLGFGTARTDVCSTCEQKRNSMKACEDATVKLRLALELLLHKNEARKFYRLLKAPIEDSTAAFAVDMMQNQPLPKLAIGEAFYARQVWQYLLGIVRHFGADSRQRREDCYLYTWTEHEAGKGSNEIASALADFFRHFVNENPHIATIRLFSDSCAAQNKNYSLLVVFAGLARELNVTFELNYPVAGHSFLPADRLFGRLEKTLRRYDTLLTPQEYYPLFETVANVRILNRDWFTYCFQEATKPLLRSQPRFKISEMKFIRVYGDGTAECCPQYDGQLIRESLLKNNKLFNLFQVRNVPRASTFRPLSKEKVADVTLLLQKAGITGVHPATEFYRRLVSAADDDASPPPTR